MFLLCFFRSPGLGALNVTECARNAIRVGIFESSMPLKSHQELNESLSADKSRAHWTNMIGGNHADQKNGKSATLSLSLFTSNKLRVAKTWKPSK